MASSSAVLLPQSPMEIIEQEQLAWQIGGREWEVTEGYSIILYIILYPLLVKTWGGAKEHKAHISPPNTGAGCRLSF